MVDGEQNQKPMEPNMQKEKEPNMKKVKEPSVTIRCSLASLHDFANLLTPGAKAKVIEIGFQNILKLPSIRNPLKVTETLMDRARVTDEGRILLPIKDEVDLILEPEDVSLILGIGMAGGQSKELPQANDQSSNVLDKMYSLLKYASDKHGTKKHPKPVQSKDKDDELVQGQEQDETVPSEVQDEDAGAGPGQPAKKHRRDYFCSGSIRALLLAYKCDKVVQAKLNDDMIAKLFCMEVLDRFLLSSSSSTIPSTIQDAVTNLENLKNVDWCTLVYERVKTSIIEWKNSSNKKNKNVTGCIFLLLVSILVSLLVLCREPII